MANKESIISHFDFTSALIRHPVISSDELEELENFLIQWNYKIYKACSGAYRSPDDSDYRTAEGMTDADRARIIKGWQILRKQYEAECKKARLEFQKKIEESRSFFPSLQLRID